MFSEAYRLLNGKPFSIDSLKVEKYLDKINALKILTLNNYIQLPKNEKLQKITADDYSKALIDWIKLCGENEKLIDLKVVENSLLMLIADYYVSEKVMKKKLLRIKDLAKDKRKQYNQLKREIHNTSGVSIRGGESRLILDKVKHFILHKLNVTAGKENFSFHINLLLYVKKVKELTQYSFMNIFVLYSHSLEYFNLLPSNYSVVSFAYSLRNKYYRLKDHREKVLEILKLEYDLYKTKLELDPDDVSLLLNWLESELS